MAVSDPQIAYYAPDRAVAVWAQSALGETEFAAATFTETVKAQHLVYAEWDGYEWSDSASLTLPSTGDGQVALGACSSMTAGCPAVGVLTAVWVRDVGGALAERRFRLYYATYQNHVWSYPLPLDAGSQATDSQPAVAYAVNPRDALPELDPLVVWVRDGDRDLGTLADRRIATVWLDDGNVAVQNGLGDGVVELSLATDGNQAPLLAFTRVEEFEPGAFAGLLDSRHVLHSGRIECTPTPAECIWTGTQLLDSHGRGIRAERPTLTLDDQELATITFRGLGFGPLPDGTYATFPDETVGMALGTGELVQLPVDFSGGAFDPHYLTHDGALYWQPAAVYNSLTDVTLTLAMQGAPLASSSSAPAGLQTLSAAGHLELAADDLVFAAAPHLPDFAISALDASTIHPEPGATIRVAVTLDNWGMGEVGGNVSLVATWDGPHGLGDSALSQMTPAPAAGQSVSELLVLEPPSEGWTKSHKLYVTVNPTQTPSEISGANNALALTIGGLPVPLGVGASTTKGSPLVYLYWEPSVHSLAAGYRVYRATGDGPLLPVGSALHSGWVDLSAEMDTLYRYAVTVYDTGGNKSAMSESLALEDSTLETVTAPAGALGDITGSRACDVRTPPANGSGGGYRSEARAR